MSTIITQPRKWGWLILDLLGGFTLALGGFVVADPETAAGFGVPANWGWPLIVVGAVVMFSAGLMFVRQLRAQRTN